METPYELKKDSYLDGYKNGHIDGYAECQKRYRNVLADILGMTDKVADETDNQLALEMLEDIREIIEEEC